jgi:hypothetical protein
LPVTFRHVHQRFDIVRVVFDLQGEVFGELEGAIQARQGWDFRDG